MPGTRTLTLDDIFALEHVVDAQISPDGAQVTFVVKRDYIEEQRALPAAAIWLVPSDGAQPARRFTHGPRTDTSPRWSPDGRMLAFLSDREKAGQLQIYIVPLDGGEARRLTDAPAGVTDVKWSPDGACLAYLAPDAESEEERQRKEEHNDPVHLDHDYKFTRLWMIDAAGGEARAITPPAYQVRGFAWYGDGWAMLTTPTPLMNDFVRWRLAYVAEDQPEATIRQMPHGTFGLAGSPDGRALAWVESGAHIEESVDELWVLLPGGTPRCLAADYAGGMVWTGWMPDGASLLVGAIDGTRTLLGRVAIETGDIITLLEGQTLAEAFQETPRASVSREGRLAAVIEDGVHPKEIWTGQLGGTLHKVTAFNTHLHDVALGAVESIRWPAPDGRDISGVLIYPSGYTAGRRYPLIVQIHGGPLWQWLERCMISWHDWGQWLAAHGYAVLLPNPRGSFGCGRDFAHCNRGAWGSGDLGDVFSGVDHLLERGLADPERLGIGGWSYGGYLTAWAIGHTDRFKAAIVGAGVTNLLSCQANDISGWLPNHQMLVSPYEQPEVYLRCSPIAYAAHMTTPTLILHGEKDERVRLGQGRELYNALRYLDVPAEMVVYPRQPHTINEHHHQRDLLTRVLAWFDRWLAPSEPRTENREPMSV